MEMTLTQAKKRHTTTNNIVSNLQAQMQYKLSSQPFHNLKENVMP